MVKLFAKVRYGLVFLVILGLASVLFMMAFGLFQLGDLSFPAIALVLLGSMLNMAVVVSNGFKMPFYDPHQVTDAWVFEKYKQTHKLFTKPKQVKLFFLADIHKIQIRDNWYFYSWGDVILISGGIIFFGGLFI